MQLPKHWEGWFLLLFSIQFFIGLALVIDYVEPNTRIWPDRIVDVIKLMPYVVVVAATIASMEVEAVYMLAERYLRKRFQEGEQQGIAKGEQRGIEKGVQKLAEKVEEWNKRRLEAESRGEKFDEPPPTKV